MSGINTILSLEDTAVIYRRLTNRKKPFKLSLEESENQWNYEKHKVMDEHYRKKKVIKVKTDKVDHKTGEPIYKEKKVDRCRIAVPVQRVIVERAVGFLFSIPVDYKMLNDTNEETTALFDDVKKIMHDNKMRYFDKKLARTLFRCRECAELWYMVLDERGKPREMRCKLLSPIYGDMLFPHFDDYDRMDGFSRKYQSWNEEEEKYETFFDVYNDRYLYHYKVNASTLELVDKPKQHGFTKVPVIYYRQEESEWESVQPLIERVEELLSNWGDTNDYFGTPSYFFKGKLKGFAEKGEVGKVYQGDGEGADMKVLSWDSSPASVTGELGNLFANIFSCTQSADISFENMKTLGNNTSGAAIKLMFTDPHMKAQTKIELFGELFTRRFNLIMNGYAVSLAVPAVPDRVINSIEIEPIFTPYIPKNELEEIQIINSSTGGKATMSQEEGVKQNPRVKNPNEVLEQIKAEEQNSMMQQAFGMATE